MNITKDELNKLKQTYPKGTRVKLIKMEDLYSRLEPGDLGTVTHVDAIGTVRINWDKGSTLGAIYKEDIIEKIANRDS